MIKEYLVHESGIRYTGGIAGGTFVLTSLSFIWHQHDYRIINGNRVFFIANTLWNQ